LAKKAGKALTREKILDCSLSLVDERGLSGFSIRALGDKLGVKGMAVYYYFPRKDDIVDALVGELMSRVDLAETESDWLERMRRLHRSLRSVILEHPNLVPAVIMRPFNTAPAVRITEIVLDVLLTAGFDERRALHAYQALRAYVLGYVMTESVGFISDPPSWDNRDRMRIQEYGDHGFVRMLQVIPEAAVFDHDEDYARGLDAMLSGLQDVLTECHRQRLLDRSTPDLALENESRQEGLLLNDVKSL
jgi:AcrR family transcriptional regulator